MHVSFRFLCADMPVPSGILGVDIAGGMTVGQALAECLKRNPIDDPLNQLPESTFLIGGKPAQLDTALQDGDTVMVTRTLHGG